MRVFTKPEKFLIKTDPILRQLINRQTLKPRSRSKNYFESLTRSIIGQQVSVKAAQTIFNRFAEETDMSPEKVAALDDVMVKRIGLSRQKTSYLKDLASHFVKDPNLYNHLDNLDDEDVIADLTAVKGIGVWTAQMFLMFTLKRPDIFAVDDVGLQKAMLNLYGWSQLPNKTELNRIAEKWKPYRTTACMHLWQSLDNKPIN